MTNNPIGSFNPSNPFNFTNEEIYKKLEEKRYHIMLTQTLADMLGSICYLSGKDREFRNKILDEILSSIPGYNDNKIITWEIHRIALVLGAKIMIRELEGISLINGIPNIKKEENNV